MSDNVPHIDLGMTPGGQPVALVGQAGEEARDMATLLRLAPGIALPAHARDAALLVNHLAHGSAYQVITDPAAFERDYRNRLLQEDPAAPFRDGVHRLRDFGIPDFATIQPPRFDGPRLTFYATDRALGVPYRVTAAPLGAAPAYDPLPLTPLPPAPRRPAAPQIPPLSPAERAARQTIRPGDLPP